MKRVQNVISESRLTLPVVATYGMGTWAAAGLFHEQWWIQLACFAISTYLMIELNNSNALIRIYSRMVSCSFIILSSAMCFLFHQSGYCRTVRHCILHHALPMLSGPSGRRTHFLRIHLSRTGKYVLRTYLILRTGCMVAHGVLSAIIRMAFFSCFCHRTYNSLLVCFRILHLS